MSAVSQFETSSHTALPIPTTITRCFYQVGGQYLDRLDIIADIFNRVLTPLYGSQEKALRQIRESTDRKCFLLFENENPVGVVAFKTQLSNEFAEYGTSESIEIKSLFVDRPEQNSGKGLGSALLEKLKEEVNKLALGHKGIHVTVSYNRPESLKFFQKKGFNIVHVWSDRYVKGMKEYLLSCPLRIETIGKNLIITFLKPQEEQSKTDPVPCLTRLCTT